MLRSVTLRKRMSESLLARSVLLARKEIAAFASKSLYWHHVLTHGADLTIGAHQAYSS